MKEDELMQVSGLVVQFRSDRGTARAVNGVSFSIARGETLAIVGESGSGKSVTSLSLTDLLPEGSTICSGEVKLADPSGRMPAETYQPGTGQLLRLRGSVIAYIFQEPMTALNPVLTCGFQVEEVLRLHRGMTARQAKEEAIRLFQEVRIPRPAEAIEKYPHQMSGGQRQRVMIAMAVAARPALLVADEPTTALDVTVQRAVIDLLKDLQRTYGLSMLFITHDLGLVADVADRVLVMKDGEVVEQGSADQVLKQPAHPYTRALMAARPETASKGFLLGAEQAERHAIPVREPGEVILQVTDLTREYRGKHGSILAVDGVSLALRKGFTMGLAGESGCGKTTLSRMLMGLIPPTRGSIRLLGKELAGAGSRQWREARKHIQLVFQDPYSALNGTMTIGQILAEPMIFHGLCRRSDAEERSAALLERVGLSADHLSRYPHEFSGGQRQRIVIARALAVEPEVLICDESVSALDVSVQAQVLNLLNQLKYDLGLTYLFISHDLHVVYYMSDEITIMKDGRVEESGPAADVFLRPARSYTRQLLESIPGR